MTATRLQHSDSPPGPAADPRGVSVRQREAEHAALEDYLNHQLAPSTPRAYRSDWQQFQAWCQRRQRTACPAGPETIALFLASQAGNGLKVSTLERRLAAIRLAHDVAGHLLPTSHKVVRGALAGIARKHGRRAQPKAPALADQVKAMAGATLDSLRGWRDRALLLLGFAGAFRRSELVAIRVEDLTFELDGLRVHLRRSKIDPQGRGQTVPVIRGQHACPVRAVSDWLARTGLASGPMFVRLGRDGQPQSGRALSAQTIALIVKWYAFKTGFDSRQYSGHSLRRGFATQAAMNGATPYKLRTVTRQTLATLQDYIDEAEAFIDHAGRKML